MHVTRHTCKRYSPGSARVSGSSGCLCDRGDFGAVRLDSTPTYHLVSSTDAPSTSTVSQQISTCLHDELSHHSDENCLFHTICCQPGWQDSSSEELRLKDMQQLGQLNMQPASTANNLNPPNSPSPGHYTLLYYEKDNGNVKCSVVGIYGGPVIAGTHAFKYISKENHNLVTLYGFKRVDKAEMLGSIDQPGLHWHVDERKELVIKAYSAFLGWKATAQVVKAPF